MVHSRSLGHHLLPGIGVVGTVVVILAACASHRGSTQRVDEELVEDELSSLLTEPVDGDILNAKNVEHDVELSDEPDTQPEPVCEESAPPEEGDSLPGVVIHETAACTSPGPPDLIWAGDRVAIVWLENENPSLRERWGSYLEFGRGVKAFASVVDASGSPGKAVDLAQFGTAGDMRILRGEATTPVWHDSTFAAAWVVWSEDPIMSEGTTPGHYVVARWSLDGALVQGPTKVESASVEPISGYCPNRIALVASKRGLYLARPVRQGDSGCVHHEGEDDPSESILTARLDSSLALEPARHICADVLRGFDVEAFGQGELFWISNAHVAYYEDIICTPPVKGCQRSFWPSSNPLLRSHTLKSALLFVNEESTSKERSLFDDDGTFRLSIVPAPGRSKVKAVSQVGFEELELSWPPRGPALVANMTKGRHRLFLSPGDRVPMDLLSISLGMEFRATVAMWTGQRIVIVWSAGRQIRLLTLDRNSWLEQRSARSSE